MILSKSKSIEANQVLKLLFQNMPETDNLELIHGLVIHLRSRPKSPRVHLYVETDLGIYYLGYCPKTEEGIINAIDLFSWNLFGSN